MTSPPSADFLRIAKALADPQRRELLEKIARSGEVSCTVLVGMCPVSQATVSHHLKELVNAGLLERRKEGQFGYYRFVPTRLAAYTEELARRMGLTPSTAEI
jgi:ArsR family transcriptional regulator, arsenate/arsenite/antimonite-responsive transcriptional repressor